VLSGLPIGGRSHTWLPYQKEDGKNVSMTNIVKDYTCTF